MSHERLETSEEKDVVAYAERHGVESIKLNLTGNVGWPDRLFLAPDCPIFIEFKRKNLDAEPIQYSRIRYLLRNRYHVYICDSAAKAIAILESLGVHEKRG